MSPRWLKKIQIINWMALSVWEKWSIQSWPSNLRIIPVRPAFDYLIQDSNRYITLAPKSYNLNIAGNNTFGFLLTLKESKFYIGYHRAILDPKPVRGGFKISGTPIFYILLFYLCILAWILCQKKRDLEYAGKINLKLNYKPPEISIWKELEILKSSSDTKQGLADVHTMVVGYLSQKWIITGTYFVKDRMGWFNH